MVIVLPNEKDGLNSIEEKLSLVDFEALKNKMPVKVCVTLPKFKLEETLKLVPILQSVCSSRAYLI